MYDSFSLKLVRVSTGSEKDLDMALKRKSF
jgi:hypothetical protein